MRKITSCQRIAEMARTYIDEFIGIEVRPVNYMDDGSGEICVLYPSKEQHTAIYHTILGMCLMYAEDHHINTKDHWNKQPCVTKTEKGSFVFYRIFTEETMRFGKAIGMKED